MGLKIGEIPSVYEPIPMPRKMVMVDIALSPRMNCESVSFHIFELVDMTFRVMRFEEGTMREPWIDGGL